MRKRPLVPMPVPGSASDVPGVAVLKKAAQWVTETAVSGMKAMGAGEDPAEQKVIALFTSVARGDQSQATLDAFAEFLREADEAAATEPGVAEFLGSLAVTATALASGDKAAIARAVASLLKSAVEALSKARVDGRVRSDETADALHAEIDRLRLELSKAEVSRVPRPIVRMLMDTRGGRLSTSPGHELRLADTRGGKFLKVAGVTYWDVWVPSGQLALPFVQSVDLSNAPNAPTLVRAKLKPGAMQLWTALCALTREHDAQCAEEDRGKGIFVYNAPHILLDLYECAPEYETKGGKRYARAPRDAQRRLDAHLKELMSVFVSAIGEPGSMLRMDAPEQLIASYTDDATGRVRHRHAFVSSQAMAKNYVQVPTAVLRLDARDAPMALGLATLWRRVIVANVIRGQGHHRLTLRELADAVGEDWRTRASHNGRSYWSDLSTKLERVMRGGSLGTIRIAAPDPDAIVILEPTDALAMVYQDLDQAITRATAREAIEASRSEQSTRRKSPAQRKPRRQ